MAGIGFTLRKLARQDNLSGISLAFFHSSAASTGPWICTILMQVVVAYFGSRHLTYDELYNFRVLIIYNFCISFLLTSPVSIVCTRYLSDMIYFRDVTRAIGMLLGSLTFIFVSQSIFAFAFYCSISNLDLFTVTLVVINLLSVSATWQISIFLSALKNYLAISWAFFIGFMVTFVACMLFVEPFKFVGVILGFTLGFCVIAGLLVSQIFAEYPLQCTQPFFFLRYFKTHWQIAVASFLSGCAIWVDKWILWFSPYAELTAINLRIFVNYDRGILLSYLVTIPALAIFLLLVETSFFEKYIAFFSKINQQATLSQIYRSQQDMVNNFKENARILLVIQSSLCMLFLILSPSVFNTFRLEYLQLGIFRFGLIGAFFQVMTNFMLIFLSYLDDKKKVLIVNLVMVIANTIFTLFFFNKGYEYYGLGFTLAMISGFILAAYYCEQNLRSLVYDSFVTRNSAIIEG